MLVASFHNSCWVTPTLRIASLVPSLTELLFDLDLGEAVVARTGFCIHPREKLSKIPKVGGTKDVDLEKLLATSPTHVVVNIDENRKELVAELRRRVPTIVVTHPLTPDDNMALYREFGVLFDRTHQADSLTRDYAAARAALAFEVANAAPRRVLYLIWKEPWYTVSRDTYVSSLLALANLQTTPSSTTTRYPVLDAADPAWDEAECILLSSEPYAFRQKHVDALSHSLAIPRPVLLVDGELLSWYGSRAISGLRYLAGLRSQVDSVVPRASDKVA